MLRHWKLCSLAVVLCLSVSPVFADSTARIVRLSYVEGDVQLDRADGRGFDRAFINMPLIEGARVWTREDARAEIEFEDGSTVRLAPDTILDFQRLRMDDRGGRISFLGMQQGTAYFSIKSRGKDSFQLYMDHRQVNVPESARFRVAAGSGELRVTVFRGELEVFRDNGDRVALRKGETFNIDYNDPDRYYLSKNLASEPYDAWDRDRDEERSRYTRVEQNYRQSPDYAYGYSDLYRYGSFIYAANYGYVWRPYYVTSYWDPFYDGSWVWYPGAGYVWVSPYVWGWTPYRYGSWLHISNIGWCWRPGHSFHRWAVAPHVIAPPHFTHVVQPRHLTQNVIVVRGGGRVIDPVREHRLLGEPVEDHGLSRTNRGAVVGSATPATPATTAPSVNLPAERPSRIGRERGEVIDNEALDRLRERDRNAGGLDRTERVRGQDSPIGARGPEIRPERAIRTEGDAPPQVLTAPMEPKKQSREPEIRPQRAIRTEGDAPPQVRMEPEDRPRGPEVRTERPARTDVAPQRGQSVTPASTPPSPSPATVEHNQRPQRVEPQRVDPPRGLPSRSEPTRSEPTRTVPDDRPQRVSPPPASRERSFESSRRQSPGPMREFGFRPSAAPRSMERSAPPSQRPNRSRERR